LASKEIILLQALHQPEPPDVDSEAHRHAYNTAFNELDLDWYWDAETFARLRPYGRAGVRAYVETARPHLLRAYDVDFLVDAIELVKARCHARIAAAVDVGRSLQPAPRLVA
jgi:hypothetical protein